MAVRIPREVTYQDFAPGFEDMMSVGAWLIEKCRRQGTINIFAMQQSGSDQDKFTVMDGSTAVKIQGFHNVYRLADGSILDPMAEFGNALWPWRTDGPLDPGSLDPEDVLAIPPAQLQPPLALLWPEKLEYRHYSVWSSVLARALPLWYHFEVIGSKLFASDYALQVVTLSGFAGSSIRQPQLRIFF